MIVPKVVFISLAFLRIPLHSSSCYLYICKERHNQHLSNVFNTTYQHEDPLRIQDFWNSFPPRTPCPIPSLVDTAKAFAN